MRWKIGDMGSGPRLQAFRGTTPPRRLCYPSRSASVQREAVLAQVARERGAFGLGRLARLVLRPPVQVHGTELLGRAMLLFRYRMDGVAAPVVVGHRLAQDPVVVDIAMRRDGTGQAQAHE